MYYLLLFIFIHIYHSHTLLIIYTNIYYFSSGRRLGGPPLCYSSCGQCLAIWEESSKLPYGVIVPEAVGGRAGCGYANGKVGEVILYCW